MQGGKEQVMQTRLPFWSFVATKQVHKSDSSNNQAKIFHGNRNVERNEEMKWASTSSTQMLIRDSAVNNTNPIR